MQVQDWEYKILTKTWTKEAEIKTGLFFFHYASTLFYLLSSGCSLLQGSASDLAVYGNKLLVRTTLALGGWEQVCWQRWQTGAGSWEERKSMHLSGSVFSFTFVGAIILCFLISCPHLPCLTPVPCCHWTQMLSQYLWFVAMSAFSLFLCSLKHFFLSSPSCRSASLGLN